MTSVTDPSTCGLTRKIRRFLQRSELCGKGFLLAVSGGADSVALLFAFSELSEQLRLRFSVASIDHGLRPESADDCNFVASLAYQLGVDCFVERVEVGKRYGIEAAARKARYAALKRLAEKDRRDFIATAHTLEDQVETLMLRLGRGAGTRGLRGILPLRGNVLRPMLEVSREEVARFLATRQIVPRYDSTNSSQVFARNRVRAKVLPALSEALGAGSFKAIARSAEVAREDEQFLERLARKRAKRIFGERDGEEAKIESLQALPVALRWRVLRQTAKRMGLNLSLGHTRDMDSLLLSSGPAAIDLPKGFEFRVAYGSASLRRARKSVPKNIDETIDETGDFESQHVLVPGPGRYQLDRFEILVNEPEPQNRPTGAAIRIDPAKVALPLTIRYRQPGDRFRPRGGHQKKLKSFLIDQKIPRERRNRLPLLVDAKGRVLWVVGVRVSDAAEEGERAKIAWELSARLIEPGDSAE